MWRWKQAWTRTKLKIKQKSLQTGNVNLSQNVAHHRMKFYIPKTLVNKYTTRSVSLLSRSLYRSHVLNTFFGPVLGAMMKQVCWHSRRSEAHRGLPETRGLPEARPRTQNVVARGQSEAHGDSNLYNTRQDWMIWKTHAPCGTLTSKHMHIFVPRCSVSLAK